MLYIQRKETFNGNTTPTIVWMLKTTDSKALYKIIRECKTKKEAIKLLELYNTIDLTLNPSRGK
jgi:hypothetical protein